jgi:hypothetical protein
MDAHVAPVRSEPVADRRRKPQNSQEPRAEVAEDDVNVAGYYGLVVTKQVDPYIAFVTLRLYRSRLIALDKSYIVRHYMCQSYIKSKC